MARQREREREIVQAAADDGDDVASMAIHDMGQDNDDLPEMREPSRGDTVFIFTVSFFYIGRIVGESHDKICLAAGSATVFDTGPHSECFGQGLVKKCERMPLVRWIRKGCICDITEWPFAIPENV